eukprot:scaffold20975_cov75-Phaeocystis_antarctica.AAC.3
MSSKSKPRSFFSTESEEGDLRFGVLELDAVKFQRIRKRLILKVGRRQQLRLPLRLLVVDELGAVVKLPHIVEEVVDLGGDLGALFASELLGKGLDPLILHSELVEDVLDVRAVARQARHNVAAEDKVPARARATHLGVVRGRGEVRSGEVLTSSAPPGSSRPPSTPSYDPPRPEGRRPSVLRTPAPETSLRGGPPPRSQGRTSAPHRHFHRRASVP